MRKFLTYLLVIVVTVSLGFAVFYLVRDNEKIALSKTTLYMEKGDTIELALDMSKNNSYTKISVSSSNEKVVSIKSRDINVKKGIAKATLVANEGGVVRVNFQTNNSKFRNLYCDITIGDGVNTPYYISTAEQLSKIGRVLPNGEENKYTLDSKYEIVANIDLSQADDQWAPIGSEVSPFTGSINGNGYTLYNMVITNPSAKNIGLFANIGAGATVENINFSNVNIVTNSTTETVGCVAGINEGSVSRIGVSDMTISNTNASCYVGGIVGKNLSSFGVSAPQTASVTRCWSNATINGGIDGDITTPVVGYVGGITALNKGGIVAYCYTRGSAVIGSVDCYGGIVGYNQYVANNKSAGYGYSKDLSAFIRDCYTTIAVSGDTTSLGSIGAIVGQNNDVAGDSKINKILGCYYSEDSISSSVNGVCGVVDNTNYIIANRTPLSAMKSLANYTSFIEKQCYIDEGIIKYRDGNTVYWDKNIWAVDSSKNDGLPILNMTAMTVNPTQISGGQFEVVNDISTLHDLMASNLDGQYAVELTIDAAGYEWEPIGTLEKPFTGKVIGGGLNQDYSVISGLTIKSNISTNYAGMFGCIGEGASIENICINGAVVNTSNCDVAGTIAAYNNGTISNCKIINTLVSANNEVGAVVGENNGTIEGCEVVGGVETVDTIEGSSSALIYASGSENAYIGAIAGLNNGSIVRLVQLNGQNEVVSAKNNIVKGFVNIKCSDALAGELFAGGAVGKNESNGVVSYVEVETNNAYNSKNYGIIVGDVNGYLGGIAGYSIGSINNVKASTYILASASKNTWVGGIAGVFVGKENSSDGDTAITFAHVVNSNICGKYVGGIVASLNTSYTQKYNIDNNVARLLWSEQYKVKDSLYTSDLKYAIYAVGVDDDVTLGGGTTGGIAYSISNGVVLDAYSRANLAGSNNAGIVYYISFNGANKTGGLMNRIYAVVKFDAGSTNYAVSASNIHSDTWLLKNRTAGFIDEYFYTIEKDKNSKKPTYSSFLSDVANLFTNDNNRITKRDRSAAAMKNATIWENFVSDSGVTGRSVWTVGNGYPSISQLL